MDVVAPEYYLSSNEIDDDGNDWDYDITVPNEHMDKAQEKTGFDETQSKDESPAKDIAVHSALPAMPLPLNDNGISTPLISMMPNSQESVGAYCCKQCSYTCDDETMLEVHTEKHQYMKTLSCVYCCYKTISDVHFARHLSDHEIERQVVENGDEEDAFEDDWQMFYTGPNKPDSSVALNNGEVDGHVSDFLPGTAGSNQEDSKCSVSMQRMSPAGKSEFSKVDVEEDIDNLFCDTTVTATMKYGKWCCSACDFSTEFFNRMKQHFLSHNDFEGFSVSLQGSICKNNLEKLPNGVRKRGRPPKKQKLSDVPPPNKSLIGSGSATARMWYKKWRCSLCKFSTKDRSLMEEHLLIHDAATSRCHQDSENGRTLNTEASPTNSPLERYLKKTLSVKDRTLSPDKNETGKGNKGSLKCPFCSVVSVNLVSHENHIILCHIYEAEEAENGAAGMRISARPSTSCFKRAPNQTPEAPCTTNSYFQDYVVSLSDEEAESSEYESSKDVPPKRKKKRKKRCPNPKAKRASFTGKMAVSKSCDLNKNTLMKPTTSLDEASLLASSEKAGTVPVIPVVNGPKWPKLSEEELAAITLVCPICPFKSFMVHKFEEHLAKIHKNAVVYLCSRCPFVSLNEKVYLKHKKLHDVTGLSPITLCCPNCFSKTNYYHSFVRHAKDCLAITEEEGFHSHGNHICVFCKYRTLDLEFYKQHLLNHIRNEKLTCPKCPFETCRRDMYRLHLSLEHNLVPRKIRCPKCTYTTTQQIHLNRHLHYKHNENRKVRRPPVIKTYLPIESEGKENYTNTHDESKSPNHEDFDEFVDYSRVTEDFMGAGSSVVEEEEYPNSDEDSISSRDKTLLESSFNSSSPGASEKERSVKSPSQSNRNSVKKLASSPKNSEHICLFCSQKFSSSITLGRHVKLHACEGTFTCPMCNFSSERFKLLHSHFMADHPEVIF